MEPISGNTHWWETSWSSRLKCRNGTLLALPYNVSGTSVLSTTRKSYAVPSVPLPVFLRQGLLSKVCKILQNSKKGRIISSMQYSLHYSVHRCIHQTGRGSQRSVFLSPCKPLAHPKTLHSFILPFHSFQRSFSTIPHLMHLPPIKKVQ